VNRLRIIGLAGALLVTATALEAQTQRVFRPRQGAPRQAAQPITKAEPADVAPASPSYPISRTLVPAIIMSDGSVYANFGYGYELVRRRCAALPVLGSNGPLGQPTYTQPVPAQLTASEQAIRSQNQTPSAQASASCYRLAAYGPVVVVR